MEKYALLQLPEIVDCIEARGGWRLEFLSGGGPLRKKSIGGCSYLFYLFFKASFFF